MVFKVCMKFHENMSSGFKVMELELRRLVMLNISTISTISFCVIISTGIKVIERTQFLN